MKKALCSNHKKIVGLLNTWWEPPFTSPNCKVKDVELGGINKFLSGGGSCNCNTHIHQHISTTHFAHNSFLVWRLPLLLIHTHTTHFWIGGTNKFSTWGGSHSHKFHTQHIFKATNKFLAWKKLMLLQITTHKHTKQIFDLVVAKAPLNQNKSKAQLPLLCKTHDVGRNSSDLESLRWNLSSSSLYVITIMLVVFIIIIINFG